MHIHSITMPCHLVQNMRVFTFFTSTHFVLFMFMCAKICIPYGTKILHGIKFYGFMVVSRTVKLKSINFYYCVAKMLSCFDNRKFKICQLFLIQ